MKKLDPITVGTHTVQIIVSENAAYPHVLFFEAVCCGQTQIENAMTHQGQSDHSDEQFAEDVAAHTQRLAQEVAGRCRSSVLVAQFAKG
jgi:hypothetical protein